MNDCKYIFKKDISEKKQLSKSSHAKKGGRGSRKCSLPSDYLTKKQLKERNGKCVSIKLNEKMKWENFKQFDRTLQLEYIKNLKEKYEARNIDIANMLGTSYKNFSSYIARQLPEIKQSHRGGGTSVMSKKWLEFISQETRDCVESNTEALQQNEIPEYNSHQRKSKKRIQKPQRLNRATITLLSTTVHFSSKD